jgi:hypothetical protein
MEGDMHGESIETRLARLEEAMVSVKGDTIYLRRGFDGFKEHYWKELAKSAGKVGYLSAFVSLFVGGITAAVAHVILN